MNCTVIKIGGKLVENPELLGRLCDRLVKVSPPFIVVHGGGTLAGELCRLLDIPEQMVGGRRVTDEETLRVAVMTYAGWVNKTVVSALQHRGINACGLSGCDMQVVTARKRPRTDRDWGYVGDIEAVNTAVLTMFLRQGIVPVLSPITYGIHGAVLNTNADSVASAVAEAMAKGGLVDLVFCMDKRGVMKDIGDEDSLISHLNREQYEQYKQEGVIHSGMLPKLENAFTSIARGVRSVRLVHPDELDDVGAGTTVALGGRVES